jgi:aryl-alcohol dehydrogenase-like predicted oxidoreductase
MRRRPLGDTQVSALALGTVALGVDYGIAAPGDFGRPSARDAEALIQAAVEAGITLFDTAPAYGEAERRLGRALARAPHCLIATKVAGTAEDVEASIERSRRALRRDVLDIVQIHNATAQMLADGRLVERLQSLQARGVIGRLGVSVYGEEAALAAIKAGCFELIQAAYNIFDRRMEPRVFPAAPAVLARSAFLKGALTPKAQFLPAALAPLRHQAERAADIAGGWPALPALALRFCLSCPPITAVLIGPRTLGELDAALTAERAGPLDADMLAALAPLALDDDRLVNPAHWPVS